jgi:hypothetical protein
VPDTVQIRQEIARITQNASQLFSCFWCIIFASDRFIYGMYKANMKRSFRPYDSIWVMRGLVTSMDEGIRKAHRILVGKVLKHWLLGRSGCTGGNIKTDPGRRGCSKTD